MKLILLVLSVSIPILTGFTLVNFIYAERAGKYRLFLLGLIPGLGLAVSSLPFFLYYLIGYPEQWLAIYITCEVLALMGLGWYCFHTVGFTLFHGLKLDLKSSPVLILVIILAAATIVATIQFWNTTLANPYGSWDAWTIWNLRARFLFSGQGNLTAIFSPTIFWSHLDYPLLLPASIARIWFYLGSDDQLIPAGLAFIFLLSTAAILGGALIDLGLVVQGLLAAFVLVCTPFFIFAGSNQCADVLVSFFLCGIVILYYLYHVSEGEKKMLLLFLGLLLGSVAWTKNEGMSILVSFLGLWAIFEILFKKVKFRLFLTKTTYLCLGLLPFGIALVIFKLILAPASEYSTSNTLAGLFQKMTDASRYLLVLHSIWNQVFGFGWWVVAIAPTLLVFILIIGLRKCANNELPALLNGTALLATILVSYFFVYIISPYPLEWHLSTSLSRLLLQLFPASLFLFFSAIKDPFTLLNGKINTNA